MLASCAFQTYPDVAFAAVQSRGAVRRHDEPSRLIDGSISQPPIRVPSSEVKVCAR